MVITALAVHSENFRKLLLCESTVLSKSNNVRINTVTFTEDSLGKIQLNRAENVTEVKSLLEQEGGAHPVPP